MNNRNFENSTEELGHVEETLDQQTQERSKRGLSKKILIAAIAVVLIITLTVSVVVSFSANKYKTPLDIVFKSLNSKEFYSEFDTYIDSLNGFTENEFKDLFEILEKSDYYEEYLETSENEFEDIIEYYEDEYGDNYNFTYKISYKHHLEKEDLDDFRDSIKDAADYLEENIEETEDFDTDDWEDMADEIGVSKADAKKIMSIFEEITKTWKEVKVSDGYKLKVTFIITGDELDEPEESEETIYVYKVNGRWIHEDAISSIPFM